jgi:hypothetical protein
MGILEFILIAALGGVLQAILQGVGGFFADLFAVFAT